MKTAAGFWLVAVGVRVAPASCRLSRRRPAFAVDRKAVRSKPVIPSVQRRSRTKSRDPVSACGTTSHKELFCNAVSKNTDAAYQAVVVEQSQAGVSRQSHIIALGSGGVLFRFNRDIHIGSFLQADFVTVLVRQ